jgi:chromosome segregation ATPase
MDEPSGPRYYDSRIQKHQNNPMTERIKELQAEIEAFNKEKEEIGHQQFSLKVRGSAIDKKLKAIEWEIEQLKTLPDAIPTKKD